MPSPARVVMITWLVDELDSRARAAILVLVNLEIIAKSSIDCNGNRAL